MPSPLRLPVVVAVVALFAFFVPAQVRAADPSTGAALAVSEASAVRAALDDFFAAATDKNWPVIDQLLAEDFQFYSDDLLVLDRAEFLAAMKDDSMEIGKLELNEVSVRVSADGQMALVRYKVTLESLIKGEAYNMKSAETVVMRKEGSAWRMIHNHASIKRL